MVILFSVFSYTINLAAVIFDFHLSIMVMSMEKSFHLVGKYVQITKGPYKGLRGVILAETGYTDGYGVVCKIKLENGNIVEYSHDFFMVIKHEKSHAQGNK